MKITTKFNLDQKVWIIHDDKVQNLAIESISVYVSGLTPIIHYHFEIEYFDGTSQFKFMENRVFNTKQQLIKSL